MSDGILRFSNAEGVTALNRYHNFLTNYGDFGALQRIGFATPSGTSNNTFFNNIPQTFQDLFVVMNVRSARATPLENINIGIPNQTSIYSSTRLIGNGSSATSVRGTNDQFFCYMGTVPAAGSTNGIFGSVVYHILNYRSSTNKTIISRSAADLNGSGETQLGVGLMRYTPAITDLFISTEFTNTTGTIALYGVRASAA